ncbi:MAG: DUF4393 domain-containing protein [Neisseriaceae bacterium]|nr:DUF4393 domain-containing protein [Neisseriaceae bacterium]
MNENSNSETKDKILLEIYKDAAQPAVRALGSALGTCFEFASSILLPLKLKNEKAKLTFQKNLEKYAEELAKIPEEKRCEVHQQIGLPILDKLTYTTEEDIADLFIALLTNAANKDMVHTALPAFVSMISELSPDEARILNYLKDKEYIEYCEFRGEKNSWFSYKGHCNFFRATMIENEVELDKEDNIGMYIANFIRLGIFVDKEGTTKVDDLIYQKIRDIHSELLNEMNKQKKTYNISSIYVEESFYKITELGKRFIQACTKSTLKEA